MNMWKCGICVLIVAVGGGCSEEQRDEAIKRTTRAAEELNGKAESDFKEHDVPNIVNEQRRKEISRQNTQWTKENQALHPVEYCQAQLGELDRMSDQLQVQVHSMATAKAAAIREHDDACAQIGSFEKLLKEAKVAYRTAEANNRWPMMLNGFQLSKDLAEQRIIEIAQRIDVLKESVAKSSRQIVLLDRRAVRLEGEQRKIVLIRERVLGVLANLKTKQVIDGTNGIEGALNDISDSMTSLATETQVPTVEELVIPDATAERSRRFMEIMAEE